MGRPTCAVWPEAINSARTVASFGCIGNRIHRRPRSDSSLPSPERNWRAVEESLAIIVRANEKLEKFDRACRITATS